MYINYKALNYLKKIQNSITRLKCLEKPVYMNEGMFFIVLPFSL